MSSPDAPEVDEDRDVLQRGPIARAIFELICQAPRDWSLRIGVFGSWGEGKTTVLNFVLRMAERTGYPVVRFSPWAVQDRTELWRSFTQAINTSLGQEVFPGLARRQKWHTVLRTSKSLADLNSYTKAAYTLLGAPFVEWLSLKKDIIEHALLEVLGDRRLVVLIDDLDRAAPDIAPHLLLSLRELLDLQQCAFLLALDPNVIGRSLPATNPGWKSNATFLEKIIDFSFWLPKPTTDSLLDLAREEIARSSIVIPTTALEPLKDLLPSNPRRLKYFFRSLWRLRSLLARHGPDEIRWSLLLFLELLKTTSPTAAERLFSSTSFRSDLAVSTILGRSMRNQVRQAPANEPASLEKVTDHVREAFKALEVEDRTAEPDFIRILEAFVDRVFNASGDEIRYWSALDLDPPVFTWKEIQLLLDTWKSTSTPAQLDNLITQHSTTFGFSHDRVYRELFSDLLNHRNQLLEAAADTGAEAEMRANLARAEYVLSAVDTMITGLRLFAGDTPTLRVNEFLDMEQRFRKWASFTNHDAYLLARRQEREILLAATTQGAGTLALPVLAALQVWNIEPRVREERREAETLQAMVSAVLEPVVFSGLLLRFSQPGGIASLWGHDQGLVEKFYLFSRAAGFYSQDRIQALREIAARAKDDDTIHRNFYDYVTMLGYGFTRVLSPLSPDLIRPLVQDTALLLLFWNAAIAQPLQPRSLGSFKDVRKTLGDVVGDVSRLPIPPWWRIQEDANVE